MLSCKTDSAKLKQAGGPVSISAISMITCDDRGHKSVAWIRASITRTVAGLAIRHFARTARTSLQQGIVAPFFFTGVECIGQPVVPGAAPSGAALTPKAQ